ncbi:MAG: glycine cleavage system protein H [Pseudobdellovibrionaceae bacterium]|nr:glycine cleavage system protein H [Bdellovibrionales bacterium]USN46648.1 MAG: glycine cleavage system protein H [Pseudobdellovibrionaceae bacterium]
MDEIVTYMGHEWVLVEDGLITIGINEDGVEELTEIQSVNLPDVNDSVSAGQVFGDIETDSGPLNLYCPVDGVVIEVNETVVENPELILEDSMDEGWLIKVEADNPDQIDMVSLDANAEDDGRTEE